MRPVREIDPEFFAAEEELAEHLPLLDAWLERHGSRQPLAGVTALLVQHQLSNQVPMLRALMALGLAPANTWWLDIPYTSHAAVRDYAEQRLGVPGRQMAVSRFPVLDAYSPYQHGRAVDMLLSVTQGLSGPLLVLDDGAYILEALASLRPVRRPSRVAIVEQTTRGFIKYEGNAMLRQVARGLPLVDVARSTSKRELEPPFIAMAVCAALQPHLLKHFPGGLRGRCLVLGYGAIGEQVASFVRHHFGIPREDVHVHDPSPSKGALAARRKYPAWDRGDFDCRFKLVVGCSGSASFTVSDSVYLEDGALLVSASSGAVELSRQEFVELAQSSADDDIAIDEEAFDPHDVHAAIPIRLVDRTATFINAGFPVNFDGRLTVCPTRYIQPTPTMMVAAAVQAVEALGRGERGVLELERGFCGWVDPVFRSLLGERAEWLLPVPDEAW